MIDEVERSGLTDAQRATVDRLALNYGRLPVFLSGRLGDEWIIVAVGHGDDLAFAVHVEGHSFGTATTWIEDLPVVADPDAVAKRVERADSLGSW